MSAPPSSPWYESFFTELPNEFWRRVASPESTRAEVAFIERHAALAPAARVLDAPCGSGRHTLALAQRGHRVTGVDISVEAIAHARGLAEGARLDCELVVGEVRTVPQRADFDAVICVGNSFGYLDAAGTRELVRAFAGALRPGGTLVIDFAAAAESVLTSLSDEARTMQAGDITVTATRRYDVATSTLVSHYRFARGDEEFVASALHHVYTCANLSEMLSDAGFSDIALFANTDDAPLTVGAGRLLITARRLPGGVGAVPA